MVEKDKKDTAVVVPPAPEQVTALRDWFIGNIHMDLDELAVKFGESDLWANIYAGVAQPVWADGFDKGEEDYLTHETFDEMCIPNPWAEQTPYTPHIRSAVPFAGE